MVKIRPLRLALAFSAVAAVASGQEDAREAASIEVTPAELRLVAGEAIQLEARVLDADGALIEDAEVLYLPLYGQFWNLERRTWGFNLFKVSREGEVSTRRPGEFGIMVRVVGARVEGSDRDADSDGYIQQRIPLVIEPRPVTQLTVEVGGPLHSGTEIPVEAAPLDSEGALVEGAEVVWSSSDPAVAFPVARPQTVEQTRTRGALRLGQPGTAVLTATTGGASASMELEVVPNPVARLTLTADRATARTGDVVHLSAAMSDRDGNALDGIGIGYSFSAITDGMGAGGPSSGLVTQDGRFVADLPGLYTLVAHTGGVSASTVVHVTERGARRPIELVGHGRVKDRATSDLWVWEAPNGRDYAITGTHSAAGHAYVWDVTDPESLEIVDVVRVDARTVNDVKISEDGATAVISREGASNRRNGLVILDVSDPATGVTKLAEYDDQLTGGVHNTFIHDGHVYALSGGQRFDIVNIEDPATPHRVGSFALDNPARSIHDVWVVEGIAYSANWSDGVAVIDVGGAGKGGTPRDPKLIGQFPFPTGWNHAVYPYRSVSTGKFYIFAGDEAARTGRYSPLAEVGTGTPGYEDEPTRWRGWIHILEWDENFEEEPRLVGRYEVPEAGSHNIWIEDDVMYVAFYNGGLRVVDVSGELLGNLYRQGREIARFLPLDPEGFLPNAPQVWGAQPHKGVIFFSDRNSGLWAVRLGDSTPVPVTDAQE